MRTARLLHIFVITVVIACSGLLYSNAMARASDEVVDSVLSKANFDNWLKQVYQESLAMGIRQSTLDEAFANIEFHPKVVSLDQKQPYKTKTFNQYKQSIVPASRIKQAKQKLNENRALLEKIGKEYGVQPRFIVALWGIESNFGQNMGSFSIVQALATLAFEGRRAEFFKAELINALKIIDQGHISVADMKGSWAGAMGQTQFMPSSFLNLAVDYNGDGKRDIWKTKADVFASIANYLSKTSWDDETTWGRQVRLPKGFDKKLADIKVQKSLSEWQKLGVRKANGESLPNRPDIMASLVRPDDSANEFYVVYSNYRTILKWNRSLYFATAVGLLADAIGNG